VVYGKEGRLKMIYIGIPTVNLQRYLKETIDSLVCEDEFKVMIVDNFSTDGTRDWVVNSGHEHILNPSNFGVARAWNQIIYWGLSHDDFEVVFIMNNDIVLHKDSLDNMMQSIRENGKEAISGVNIGINPSMLQSCTRPTFRYSPAMSFSCFGLIKSTITRVGVFDEGFKLAYFEDNDMHHRMMLEEIKCSADLWAPFTHYGSRTIKEGGVTNHADHFKQNKEFFRKKWGFVP